jgi:GTPase SAR1 family protein
VIPKVYQKKHSWDIYSLAISIFSLCVVVTQTALQWTSADVPLRANVQLLQMEACTTIIEKSARFLNNSNERMVIQAGNNASKLKGIDLMPKSDLQEERQSQENVEEALKNRELEAHEIVKVLNVFIISRSHYFEKNVQQILWGIDRTLIPLMREPGGNSEVTPGQLFSQIQELRKQCGAIGSQFSGENSPS